MTSPSHGGDHAFESRRAHNLLFDTSFNYLRLVFVFEGAEEALATRGKYHVSISMSLSPDDSINLKSIIIFEVIRCIIEVVEGKKKEL
jgi:hypothetical protein